MEAIEVRKKITDQLWEQLGPAIAVAKHSRAGAPPEMADRDFLEAVLYLQRVGCPWRDLPPVLGYWHAVYMRFRRWEKRGVWARLWQNLQTTRFQGARTLFVDSTVVRAHQHAAGAPKNGGDQALGRSRGGLTTKIHVATIDENCSVAVCLTGGQAHDGPLFEELFATLPAEHALTAAAADKAYDADRIREVLANHGLTAVIPSKANRKEPLPFDAELYKERNRIERFFNKLKQFRRIATRYDKLRRTFGAAVHLVAAFLIIKNS